MEELFKNMENGVRCAKDAKDSYDSAMCSVSAALDKLVDRLGEDEGVKFINEDGERITLSFEYSEEYGAICMSFHSEW